MVICNAAEGTGEVGLIAISMAASATTVICGPPGTTNLQTAVGQR